jgi:hypothetical protein
MGNKVPIRANGCEFADSSFTVGSRGKALNVYE